MKELGRIGVKSLIYFEVASTIALLVGLAVVNIIRPGDGMNVDVSALDTNTVSQYTQMAEKRDGLIGFVVHTVPESVVDAFARGDILQLLFFGVLFGIALSQIGPRARPAVAFMESFLTAVFRVVSIIMRVAPVGAFGAMAFTVGTYGMESLVSLGKVLACVYITCILFVVLVFGLAARLSGFGLWKFLNFIRDEIFTVAGTCSSESVLPQMMRKLEAAGVPRAVVGLVVPGGLSFNADGSAIYFTIAALFIAQATDTPLTLLQQMTILGVLMLTSKGSAGVAGAGFVTLAATLAAMHSIPVGGLVLLLGVDRFMAEARSVTNTIGNAIGAVVVAAWDGCLDREKLTLALDGHAVLSDDQETVENEQGLVGAAAF
ncbi:C4-dicarboxylate transporter DctA [Brucella endophytica]|uniref:C4-dicarboxylate transporter DctA n=1 Tax=Brucella endophytica TaxID=1963359 RepID=A0A916WBJ5_9HYPH|nr:cation:dicarboxylase symporter family transporter [Brucella endophytica]GGA83095.1 C4-dicarboxylate transporter DctA [Brucella endophytica]